MNNNFLKAVFFDLDGTLLTSEKKISKQSKLILKKLNEQGTQNFIVTGRSHLAIKDIVFNNPVSKIAVCSNGSIIYDFSKNEILSEIYFSQNLSLLLFKTFIMNNISFLAYGQKSNYYFHEGHKESEWINNILAKNNFLKKGHEHPLKKIKKDSLLEFLEEKIYKFLVIDEEFLEKGKAFIKSIKIMKTEDDQEVWDFDIFGKVQVVNSQRNIFDFNPLYSSKGNAVKNLLKILNIPKENTLAFGDANNDISMMQEVSISVAMQNATDDLKKYAQFVTDSNNDEGIFNFISSFINDL